MTIQYVLVENIVVMPDYGDYGKLTPDQILNEASDKLKKFNIDISNLNTILESLILILAILFHKKKLITFKNLNETCFEENIN